MTYQTIACDFYGKPLRHLGRFATMAGARQAMIDHAGLVDLPAGEPHFAPSAGVLEAWIIGRIEYLIEPA